MHGGVAGIRIPKFGKPVSYMYARFASKPSRKGMTAMKLGCTAYLELP